MTAPFSAFPRLEYAVQESSVLQLVHFCTVLPAFISITNMLFFFLTANPTRAARIPAESGISSRHVLPTASQC